jgi:hypothetical protein
MSHTQIRSHSISTSRSLNTHSTVRSVVCLFLEGLLWFHLLSWPLISNISTFMFHSIIFQSKAFTRRVVLFCTLNVTAHSFHYQLWIAKSVMVSNPVNFFCFIWLASYYSRLLTSRYVSLTITRLATTSIIKAFTLSTLDP